MKFIHIADVHLGMVPDQGKPWSEKRSKELYESFFEVIERCNQQSIDLLLIAGDLFHRQPLLRELKEVNYHFSKLTHTKVVLIAGNHDYIGEHSRYREFHWCEQVIFLGAKELQKIYIPEVSTTVYGFSYHQRDIKDAMYDNVLPSKEKGFHILLAHGGDEKNVPMNRKLIDMAGFDYVALGHIHKLEGLGKAMAYAGSLEPLDRNETGNHGYILGELSGNVQSHITFVPCSKRQYYHLEIEVDQDMVKGSVIDVVKEHMNRLGKQHIYKIILAGIRDPEVVFLESDFLTIGNVVEVQDNTIPDYDFERLQYQNRDNMIGMFIDAIRTCGEKDEIADKALYYGMEALLKKTR